MTVTVSKTAPNLPRNDDGTLASWAWPGGYPIYYITKDNGVLCPTCANKQEAKDVEGKDDPDYFMLASEQIVAADVNWEDSSLFCDCGVRVQSAYAEDAVDKEGNDE